MIHFLPPSQPEDGRQGRPTIAPTVDVLLANLEDGVPASDKEAARAGLVEIGKAWDHPDTQLWTRVNSLDSPWALDDLVTAVTEVGDRLDVIMIPKVEGPEDIHYVDRLVAQLEAKAGLTRPILLHAILETARGVANVEEICAASPRMQGLVARPGRPRRQPADEDHPRRRRPPRLPRAPGPRSRRHPDAPAADLPAGPVALHDRPHGRRLRDVRRARRTTGPFGDIADMVACEDQFRNAYLLGCVGAWSLHPAQIEIAKRVFSPDPADVAHARRVIAAMGDGTGAVLLDGQDGGRRVGEAVHGDRRARRAARARRDPELAARYGSRPRARSRDATVSGRRPAAAVRCCTCRRPTRGRWRRRRRSRATRIIFDLEDAVAPDAKDARPRAGRRRR